ncbi:MAG: cell division protein FtsB [Roseivirga sp.]|jgi:cell division protein FtsB
MKTFPKVPRFAKNFYFLFGTFFIGWMLFVDSNDFITQVRLHNKFNALENEKEYYLDKKIEVVKNREELTTNQELLEKFAREKYLMKKKSEDLFVIVIKN